MKNKLLLLIFSPFLLLSAQFTFAQNDREEIFTIVEQMPEFPGGPAEMMKWIIAKIDSIGIPQKEQEAEISGVSYVSFVIGKDGNVSDPKILRGVSGGPGYDEVALKIVNSMPKWTPGKQNGKNVAVQYNVPIKFTAKKK